MPANITLTADNETGPAFAELVQSLARTSQQTDEVNESYRSTERVIADLGNGVELLDKRTQGWNITTLAATSEAREEFLQLRQEVGATLQVMLHLENERRKSAQEAISQQRELISASKDTALEIGRAGAEIITTNVAQKTSTMAIRLALHGLKVYATGALGAFAAAAAPVVAALTGVATAAKLTRKAFESTGQEMEAVGHRSGEVTQYTDQTSEAVRMQTGIVARNNEELARSLNALGSNAAAQEKLAEVIKATGKTQEELGVQATNNAERMGASFDKLGNRLSEPFVQSKEAFMTWWNSSNMFQPAIDAMDKGITKFTDNVENATDSMSEGWDDLRAIVGQVSGANREEYRKEIRTLRELGNEQERLKKFRERTGDDYQRIKAINEGLAEQAGITRELNRISKLKKDQLDAEENKLKSMAAAAAANNEFQGKLMEDYTQKMQVLSNRRIAIEEQELEARREAQQRHWEEVQRMEREAAEERQRQRDLDLAFRNDQFRQRQELARQTAKNAMLMETEIKNLSIDSARARLAESRKVLDEQIAARQAAGKQFADLEAKRQANVEFSYEMQRGQIKRTLNAALSAAESELEKRRLVMRANVELHRLDEQEKLEAEKRKSDAVQAAAKKETDARIAAHNKLKEALKEDKGGGSAAQNLLDSASKDDILKQMVQNRVNEDGGANMSARERKAAEFKARRKILHEDKKGELNMAEVRQAQSQQAKATIEKAKADGKLNREQAQALESAAAELLGLSDETDKLTKEIQQIKKSIQDTGNKGQRRRAQVAGNRG